MPNNRYIGHQHHHHHHHNHRHQQNNQQQLHQIPTTATISNPYGITLIASNPPMNHNEENHLNVEYYNCPTNQQQQQQEDHLNNTMSQTAQIVLLPAQNLQVSNGLMNNHHSPTFVQKTTVAEPVQMILPTNNDLVGSYQVAAATFPNVSVLVPTTILIANQNECILIPQQQNSPNICQPNLSLQVASTNNPLFYNSSIDSPFEANNVEYEEVIQQQQPQEEQECEIIALDNNINAQAILAGIAMNDRNETILNHQPTQLINNNCQIIGIVHNGTNQVSILQQQQQPQSSLMNSTSVDQTIQQVLLSKCMDTTDNNNNNKQNRESMEIHTNDYQYDMNEFFTSIVEPSQTSSSSSTLTSFLKEKSDPDQAKEWLKDSFIVNRALKALKKANNNSNIQQSHDQNRTVQIIKRNSHQ